MLVSVVVLAPAHVGRAQCVGRPALISVAAARLAAKGSGLHALLKHGLDRLVAGRVNRQCLLAGEFQALRAVLIGQAQDAQRRAVTLLGMRLGADDVIDERAGGEPDGLAPVDQPRGRPLQVRPVGSRAMLRERAVKADARLRKG